ncbi:hypothetical protein AKJ16_DCAP02143 [Drosera capensis]
MMLCCNI